MIKIRTDKGRTTVTIGADTITVSEGKYCLREAIEFIPTYFLMAVMRGEHVFTKLPENSVTSLIPEIYPAKQVKFTESEEEHISDRVIHITA